MSDAQTGVEDFLSARSRQAPAAAPSTISEIWNANWAAAGLSSPGAAAPFADARSDIVAAIEAAAGKPLGEYARSQGLRLGAAGTPQENIGELADVAATLPEDAQKRIAPLLDWRARAQEKAAAIERTAAEVNASAYGLSANAVRLAAGVARTAVDPLNIAAMVATAPLGGEGGAAPLWQIFARQALAAGAAQAIQEPIIQSERAELGLDHGFGEGFLDVAGAAGTGGAMSSGLTLLFRGGAAALRLARSPPAASPEISGAAPRPAGPPASESPSPIASPSELKAIDPWVMRASIEGILSGQRVAPDIAETGRALSARLQQDAGFSVPVMDEGAIRRISEEAQLHDRNAELGEQLKGLPAGDQAAADTLSRIHEIEGQLGQAGDAGARRALQARRDALLTDTNPEKLAAAAAPIEQRRALEAERASIAGRLADIAAERAKLSPSAEPFNFWQRQFVPQALFDIPLAPADLDAAARVAERDQVMDAAKQPVLTPTQHGAAVDQASQAIEVGRPIEAGQGQETIIGAAVRTPDGKVFLGANHGEAAADAERAGHSINHLESDGFGTSHGRFVDRKEARAIADRAEQVAVESPNGKYLSAHQVLDEHGAPLETVEAPPIADMPLPESVKEPPPAPARAPAPKGATGPAGRPVETRSLLEHLAANGGLREDDPLIADVRSSFGKDNHFVPGFGNLIRKPAQLSTAAVRSGKRAPMSMDAARESAVEAGYLFDPGDVTGGERKITISDLLELIDREARGNRVYRLGVEAPARKADRAAAALELERHFDSELAGVGIAPASIEAPIRKRMLEIFGKEGETDPLLAYERAVMETAERKAPNVRRKAIDEIPGWDVADEPAAPDAGGRLQGERGAGAGHASREPGEADRGAPGAEPGAELGDPQLARDADRVLEEAGGDFQIRLDDSSEPVSARAALAQAEEDAVAARELADCAGVTLGDAS